MTRWSQEKKQEKTAHLNLHTPETLPILSLQADFHLPFVRSNGLLSKPEADNNERPCSCLQAYGSVLSPIPLCIPKTGSCRGHRYAQHHCLACNLGAGFQEFQKFLFLVQASPFPGHELRNRSIPLSGVQTHARRSNNPDQFWT